ncbi:hypothetical protein, partial [Streptomyces anandii]|uniref:hypothetical protein n=1 Tax=Streptomyces anandii TaxID=285454 RepID=UPI001676AF64
WPGNTDIAARVADKLVDNAVRHGRAFPDGCVVLRLMVLHSEHLRIEVDDARPEFPDFDTANTPGRPTGRGLWWVWHYRGRLTWRPKRDEDGTVAGKSVCAVLPLAWDEVIA